MNILPLEESPILISLMIWRMGIALDYINNGLILLYSIENIASLNMTH